MYPLPQAGPAESMAPWMCAGLIGWRALRAAGDARRLGVYGFGSAGQALAQICAWQHRRLHAYTRPGDAVAQLHARTLGAAWAGDSGVDPPEPRGHHLRARRRACTHGLAGRPQGRMRRAAAYT